MQRRLILGIMWACLGLFWSVSAVAQDDGTVPDLTDREAMEQRATEFLRQLGLPVEPVSPQVAQRSAQHAHRLRQSTGHMPDLRNPAGLIKFGSRTRSYADRFQKVTPIYHAVWDDLVQRCFRAVVYNEPLDETGLTPAGEDRINYAQAFTRQKWHSADKAFILTLYTESGLAETPSIRCWLETNRFAMVEPDAVEMLNAQFHRWWRIAGHAQQSKLQPYPFGDVPKMMLDYYGARTQFGTLEGCPLRLEVRLVDFAMDTEMKIYMAPDYRRACDLTPLARAEPPGPSEDVPQPKAPKKPFVIPDGPSIEL